MQEKMWKSRRHDVEKTMLSFPLVGNLSDDFVMTARTQEGFWTSQNDKILFKLYF